MNKSKYTLCNFTDLFDKNICYISEKIIVYEEIINMIYWNLNMEVPKIFEEYQICYVINHCKIFVMCTYKCVFVTLCSITINKSSNFNFNFSIKPKRAELWWNIMQQINTDFHKETVNFVYILWKML